MSKLISSPRGMTTREVVGATLTIENPRRRCIMSRARKWSLPLAVGEFCWHLSGSDDLSFIAYYAARWREFSENKSTILGSCYGKRVFGRSKKKASQWDLLVELLSKDLMSRRAILNFSQRAEDALDPNSLDVACASTLQFVIRDGAVHAIAYMRSNDVVWGLSYDIFFFTMLQELLASTLGLELGIYQHVTGSLHIYERHIPLAHAILASERLEPFEMPRMESIESIESFLRAEASVRNNYEFVKPRLPPYWEGLLSVLCFHTAMKVNDREKSKMLATQSIYADVLSPLLINTVESSEPIPAP